MSVLRSTQHVMTPEAMEALGTRLAESCLERQLNEVIITLQGPLGVGKTTLVRGFLRGMDHFGSVKSPTYTLIEPYVLAKGRVVHCDLYRLGSPSELEDIGIRDDFENAFCIIEWPEKGGAYLPTVDIQITIAFHQDGRELTFEANSQRGENVVSACCFSKTDPNRS